MSIFSADEISERTEQLESQLAALDAAIEKLKQQWQPWKASTGPKSPEGKASSSPNAYTGGTRPLLRQFSSLIRGSYPNTRSGAVHIAPYIISMYVLHISVTTASSSSHTPAHLSVNQL